MGLEYDPKAHAQSLGISIVYMTLPDSWRGAYSLHQNTIYLVSKMSKREERSTLAHEVAHALAGDEFSDFTFLTEKQEMRANLLAASNLIEPSEYRSAERLVGSHIPSLAHELNVTEFIVHFWQKWIAHHFQSPSP